MMNRTEHGWSRRSDTLTAESHGMARSRVPQPDPPPLSVQPRSSALGVEMVRRLALMLMAAGLATLVLLTQKLILTWVGDDLFLGWAALWCVLLSALLLLSRLVTVLAQWAVGALDTWVWRLARQRAARRQRVHPVWR